MDYSSLGLYKKRSTATAAATATTTTTISASRSGYCLVTFQVVLAVLYLSLTTAIYHEDSDGCTIHQDCSSCLESSSCGWCPSKDSCLSGNATGPHAAVRCNWWRFGDSNSCINEDECLPFSSSCSECTQQLNCGWCGSVCLRGSQSGPADTDAECIRWEWKLEQCQVPECDKYTSCYSCALQNQQLQNQIPKPQLEHGCGWCESTSSCLGINSNCASGWKLNVSMCSKVSSCSQHQNCSSCVKDPSLVCAWCEANKICLEVYDPLVDVSSSSSYIDKRGVSEISSKLEVLKEKCSDLRFGTCQRSCHAHLDCMGCVLDQACGMCGSFCTEGRTDGPSYLPRQYCSPWSYGNNSCQSNKCSSLKDCNQCISQGCHWCPTSLDGYPASYGGGTCNEAFDLNCCEDCQTCYRGSDSSQMMRVSAGILACVGVIGFGLIVSFAGYTFWEHYWKKRHYFERLS